MLVMEDMRGPRRELGFWETLSIGVGSTIGGSIFVILGDAVRMAGPAVVLAFGLGALATLFMALNYSELATSLPVSGGGYIFTREAVGGLASFMTGWFLWLGNVLYAALNAMGLALVVAGFLHVEPIPLAEAILAFFCLLNVMGVREAGRAQLLLTVVLTSGLLGLSLAALPAFRSTNLSPLAPRGLRGVFSAAGLTFVAYWGFESIAAVGGEIRDPDKTIPRACVLSVLISGLIYVLVSLVSVGVLGWEALAHADMPLSHVGRRALGPVGEIIVLLLGATAMLTSLNTALLSAARIAYALAKTGLFPRPFAYLHPRSGSPRRAVMLSALVASLFTLSGIIYFLAEAASFGFLIGLLVVNLSVILLRRKRRYLARAFKTPIYPITPIVAVLACLSLATFMDPLVLAVGSAVAVVGAIGFLLSLITPRGQEAAVGGFSLASYLSTSFILYVLQGYLGFGPNPQMSTAVARGLLIMCVPQALASIMTAIPLGELYISTSRAMGAEREPGLLLPTRVAKAIKALELLMASLQVASLPLAVGAIYAIYRGLIFFPSPPGPALPVAVITCLSLAFSALASAMCAAILFGRRYEPG